MSGCPPPPAIVDSYPNPQCHSLSWLWCEPDGFGHLFLYMVVLGLFHGLFVLPVILSIINPSSISDIIIKTEIAAAKTETETQKEEGAEAEGEQAEERGQKKLQTQATSNP